MRSNSVRFVPHSQHLWALHAVHSAGSPRAQLSDMRSSIHASDSRRCVRPKDRPLPPGYDYDVDLLIEEIDYYWPDDGELQINVAI